MDSIDKSLAAERDTIVAPATPAGYSGLAVIRIGGALSRQFAREIFIPAEKTAGFEANRAYAGKVVDPASGETIDEAVAVFFMAPRSYTGEDLVEISVHGNPLVVERIVDIFIRRGARLAGKGEFTRRALLNRKLDLIQAEAVLDTINAPCDQARQIAVVQYEGLLSERIRGFQAMIADLLAAVEADIDFSEEETRLDTDLLSRRVRAVQEEIDTLLANADAGIKIREGYRVAIVGRANVGKSTLFNRLLGYDRAIVHEAPGTTRDYLEEGLTIAGLYLRLTDTAGFLADARGADRIAGDRTRQRADDADLLIKVFDGSEPLSGPDLQLLGMDREKPSIIVLNKIDLNPKIGVEGVISDAIKISAMTGENVPRLKEMIAGALQPRPAVGALLLTRSRHINALRDTRDCLERARSAAQMEMAAFELHAARDLLGELTGQILRKEILDRIFDEFCVGK
jgi:tRNA modification GTPase